MVHDMNDLHSNLVCQLSQTRKSWSPWQVCRRLSVVYNNVVDVLLYFGEELLSNIVRDTVQWRAECGGVSLLSKSEVRGTGSIQLPWYSKGGCYHWYSKGRCLHGNSCFPPFHRILLALLFPVEFKRSPVWDLKRPLQLSFCFFLLQFLRLSPKSQKLAFKHQDPLDQKNSCPQFFWFLKKAIYAVSVCHIVGKFSLFCEVLRGWE